MKALYIFALLLLTGCAASKNYNPAHKYAREALIEDYRLFRNILEDAHPSLYWYTPKDSMDYYFAEGESLIGDSLNELKFRNVLSYVLSKVKCGHTTVRASRAAASYTNPQAASFPLFVKVWPDTTVVIANINRADSHITRGAVLHSIDGRSIEQLTDTMFQHLSADGYNTTHKYQTLSNSSFRGLYSALYGLKPQMQVVYTDTAGVQKASMITMYRPPKPDSTAPKVEIPRPSRKARRTARLNAARNLTYDTAHQLAILQVNTFTKGNRLRSFFRKSFKEIRKKQVPNLVVDMRSNGGGSVILSNLLTRYMADKPFKVADSLYAVRRSTPYGSYMEQRLWNWLFLVLFTRKKEDGNYHFTLFENKHFSPKKRNHFSGDGYILTGGNTFSAASLFTYALKGQQNITVVGEETGGGAYGNSAWLIPDITLPNTGVRFRLPLFRLVIDKDAVMGRGVMPEVPSLPTVEAIRNNRDFKMDAVRQLIKTKEEPIQPPD